MGPQIDKIVTIRVLDGSPYATDDFYRWMKWKRVYLDLMESQPYFKLAFQTEIPATGVTVSIYTH